MGKFNKHKSDDEGFSKCMICLEYIPVEYYFQKGDSIVCYECGTEYILTSKNPVKLSLHEGISDFNDYYGDLLFED